MRLSIRLLLRLSAITYHLSVEQPEVYPNAPVVLVAFEVRHPPADPLTPAQKSKIKSLLADVLPIARTGQLAKIEGLVGPGAPDGPSMRVERFPKYFSRDNMMAASVKDSAIVIEATRYGGWRRFRDLVHVVLRVRQEATQLDGVERVGLRYVNEVRVAEQTSVDWGPWVDVSLLGPAQVGARLGLQLAQSQGVAVFSPGHERAVVLRYGLREGDMVDPGGDLK